MRLHEQRRRRGLLVATLIGLASTIGPAPLASEEPDHSGGAARGLWTHLDAQSIRHLALTPENNLLLMTGERVALLARDNGSEIWSLEDIRGCAQQVGNNLVQLRHAVRCNYRGKFDLGFELVPDNPPLLVGHNPESGQFVLIDVTSGRTIAEFDATTPDRIMEYSYSDSRRQFVAWVETGKDSYVFVGLDATGKPGPEIETTIVKDLVWLGEPHDPAILVYGKDRASKRVIAEIDTAAGRIAWQVTGLLGNDIEDGPSIAFGSGGRWRQKPYAFAPPIADSDSTVTLFITKDGLHRISRDGTPSWKAAALAGKKPSAIQSQDGVIFGADGKDVVGVDSGDGRVVWRRKGTAALAAIEPHILGVLVWSDNSVTLLDPRTGAPLWDREARLPERWNDGSWLTSAFRSDYKTINSPRRIVGDVAYVAGANSLASIDLRNGAAETVATYKFDSNAPAKSMEIVDGDFLLTVPDGVARFDSQGQPIFQKSYKAVGTGVGTKIASVAGAIRNPYYPGMISDAFQKRYRVGDGDERYAYFLYENSHGGSEEKFGVVCVERATGKELGTFWVNRRDPKILVDTTSRTIFFQQKNDLIRAARF